MHIYLLGGVAARVARENISIDVSHPPGPSIVNGGRAVGVALSVGLVHAHYCEIVSVSLHALEVAGISALRHINAGGGDSHTDKGDEKNTEDGEHGLKSSFPIWRYELPKYDEFTFFCVATSSRISGSWDSKQSGALRCLAWLCFLNSMLKFHLLKYGMWANSLPSIYLYYIRRWI